MSLLEQHFDVAFAAPDGIKKLRELILTLAMQGKLVPQDPNDEPASELLRSIDAEKNRLIKEGKHKKSLSLPEIDHDELPYQLPKSWEWVRLGHLFRVTSGNNLTKDRMKEGSFPVYGGNGIAGYHDEFNTERPTIVIGRVGYYCGSIHLTPERAWITDNAFFTIYDEERLYQGFVIWLLKTINLQIDTSATAQPVISGGKIYPILIPLPPLAEQRRIVAKIDQLMARCDELEKLRLDRSQWLLTVHTAALDRLLTAKDSSEFSTAWSFITQHFGELYSVKENVVELRKTILQLAVMGKLVRQDPNDESVDLLLARILVEQKQLKSGKSKESQLQPLEYSIPKHWKWQCLDSILIFGPTNGFSPQAVDYETPVRSLTLSATTSGKFKGEYSKFIANEIPPDSNLWLRDGDILVQRGNTLEYVGVSAVYRGEPNCFIYPDLMMKLRISAEIDTNFIYLVMSSEPCRNFLRSRASGTSGTMPKINQTTLKSLPIPLPPLAEQGRIVEKIDRLMGMCDRLEESIESAKGKQTDLLNALMAQV
jgi:type I restriction enzyme, S subunit